MPSADYIVSFLSKFTSPSLRSFNDRLTIQKLVYLAEECGSNFGYTFGWYVNGPYSPSLTRVVYSIKTPDDNLQAKPQTLTPEDLAVVSKLSNVLRNKISDPNYLEVIASTLYHLPNRDLTKEDEDRTIQLVLSLKPHFKRKDIQDAIRRIKKLRS